MLKNLGISLLGSLISGYLYDKAESYAYKIGIGQKIESGVDRTLDYIDRKFKISEKDPIRIFDKSNED